MKTERELHVVLCRRYRYQLEEAMRVLIVIGELGVVDEDPREMKHACAQK